MKKSGILNAELAGALARLGHTDLVVVGDCGLPRPDGVPVVDLALVFGVPRFADVLEALASEIVVERCWVASEIEQANPDTHALVTRLFGDPDTMPHEEFKRRSRDAVLFVRTGEASPYANVILQSGVPF